MSFDHMHSAEFLELSSRFPLKPIEDDGSYKAAIEILDRLFAVDDLRTAAETQYFRRLAQFAAEYEMKSNSKPASVVSFAVAASDEAMVSGSS